MECSTLEKGIVFAAGDKSITGILRNHFVLVILLTQNRLARPYIGSLTTYKLHVSNARLNFLPFLSTVNLIIKNIVTQSMYVLCRNIFPFMDILPQNYTYRKN